MEKVAATRAVDPACSYAGRIGELTLNLRYDLLST